MVKIGDFVKFKNKFGLVSQKLGRSSNENGNQFYVSFHNGMKMTHDICDESDLKVLDSDELENYIKKTGHTAFRSELEKIKDSKPKGVFIASIQKHINKLILIAKDGSNGRTVSNHDFNADALPKSLARKVSKLRNGECILCKLAVVDESWTQQEFEDNPEITTHDVIDVKFAIE